MQLTALSLALTRIGLGGFGVGSALNLDFTGGNQSLDPRITFSRASNATVTGPDGTLGYAPHNLLTHSEQFDAAVWLKANATVAANATASPDGSATADTITDSLDASSAVHAVQAPAAFASGVVYTASVHVKAGTLPGAAILFPSAAFAGNIQARFNVATGVVESVDTGVTASIVPLPNGWYRCIATATATASATTNIQLRLATATTTFYQGTGAGTAFLWGAQLNIGPLQPYYPTTVKNLLGYTQEFDNAAWTKSNATVAANATTAPDGSLTADKLVETIAAGNHLATQSFSALTGATYTGSVRVKAGERSQFRLVAFDGAAAFAAYFDLAAGTVGTTLGAITPSIQSLGGGWFVCSGTFTSTATSASGNMAVRTAVAGSDSYTGDGTSGIFIWGAQLSDSASLDPYVYNPDAAPTARAYYGPRFDYDPVTLQPKGLLIEEQRTNLILRSEEFNNITTWQQGPGLVVTPNAVVSPDGTQDATTLVTSGAGQSIYQSVTVLASTSYTASVFVRLGTMPVSDYKVAVYNNTTASFIAQDIVPDQTPTAAGWTRITYAFTTPVGCTSIRWYPFRNGASITSNSVHVYGAQLEAGAFPTSYIPTTTAAATRAADVAVMTGANFSNWYRQDEGTLFVEGDAGLGSFPCFASIDDTTVNNRIQLRRANNDSFASFRMVSSSGQIDASLLSGPVTGVNKQAAAIKAADQSAAANGELFTFSAIANTPVVTQAVLGNGGGSTPLNGHIRRISYFPRRFSNSELIGITK